MKTNNIGMEKPEESTRISKSSLVEPITDIKKLNTMSAVLKTQCQRNYMLFVIGINLGMRVSDYLPMKVGDFRTACNQGFFKIIPAKTDKRYKNENGEISGKFKEVRLDISEPLKKEILGYIDGKDDDEFMFRTQKGTSMRRQTAWLILNDAAKESGITENIGCHSMRKTFGYWHYQRNHDIRLLMEIFGHSSEAITLRYIGVSAIKMKDSMMGMDFGIDTE